MSPNTRSIGLAILLLLLFLGAALALQWWLMRETRHLQNLAIEEQRARLERIIAVSGRPPERWDATFQRELGAMLGGSVQLYRAVTPPAAVIASPVTLGFTERLASAPDWEVRATFAAPALLRGEVMRQRMLAAIVLLALLLALVPLLIVVLEARRSVVGDGITRAPWNESRAQAVGLEQFARLTHERTAALQAEHGARLRAEEDLQVNRTLLDQSVAERIRLGRDLHDNICQTLYAVCLTLESVRKKSALTSEMSQRMDQCLLELRRVNQEVRAYLEELEPGRVHGQSFAVALAGMLSALPTTEDVRIERRMDPDTVGQIPPHQVAEIMSILREALSNSLRHGHARHITLLAGRSDEAIALSVQDDGIGFSPNGQRGHGLGNMRARATGLGGSLQVESAPGKGTRVILNLPVHALA
ncbi:MAG TPA: ATP-binding protein [Lacunisphaera sp.]|nr:ATP-binding protein [Lacunisphaera sp.]